jgi:hypothetical protein
MKTNLIRRILVFGLLSFALKTNIYGQTNSSINDNGGNYRNAFGIRVGQTSGFTYKHKFESDHAVEVILGTYPYALSLTALYEKYMETGTNGLQWYFGGGAHLGAPLSGNYGYYVYDETGRYRYYRTAWYGPAVGIDGIIGIEYKIPKAPVAFSFDLKPNFEFVRNRGVYGSMDPGLGIKLAF